MSEDVMLPERQTAGAAVFDLRSACTKAITPGERDTISTGLAVAIPVGYVGKIAGRSGLACRDIDVHLVVIDSDYRSELRALVLNNARKTFHGKRAIELPSSLSWLVDGKLGGAVLTNRLPSGNQVRLCRLRRLGEPSKEGGGRIPAGVALGSPPFFPTPHVSPTPPSPPPAPARAEEPELLWGFARPMDAVVQLAPYAASGAVALAFGAFALAVAWRLNAEHGHDTEFFLAARKSAPTLLVAWSFYGAGVGS
ncbi:MAG: dUTPase-like protein, partial [Olpidium bornovanus]